MVLNAVSDLYKRSLGVDIQSIDFFVDNLKLKMSRVVLYNLSTLLPINYLR